MIKIRNFYLKSANFLLSKKIKKIFVCEDGIASDFNSIILLSAARYLEIPIYNIPFGSGTEEDIEFSLKTKQSQKLLIKTHGLNLLLSKLFFKKMA